jgi:hypothetical protein
LQAWTLAEDQGAARLLEVRGGQILMADDTRKPPPPLEKAVPPPMEKAVPQPPERPLSPPTEKREGGGK